MSECGGPDALGKLSALTLQDRSRYSEKFKQRSASAANEAVAGNFECFEFQSAPPSEWAKEFARTPTGSQEDRALEQAFTRIEPSVSKSTHPWTQEFHAQAPPTSQLSKTNAAWATEFMSSMGGNMVADGWINEFTEAHTSEDVEMQMAARDILTHLPLAQDPKLANSRFVAYLKGLVSTTQLSGNSLETINKDAETATFNSWKESFLAEISPHLTATQEDQEWQQMEKMWEQYEPTGYGYKDFARREFATYQDSLPISVNPLRDLTDAAHRVITFDQGQRPLRERILAAEMILHKNPQDQRVWYHLGTLQQANEMDSQAISALLQATSLDPSDEDAWIALAASCANESCQPDAMDALAHLSPAASPKNPLAMAQTMEQLSSQAEKEKASRLLTAAAILYNIAGRQDKAISLLELLTHSASLRTPMDWASLNRLGASYANARRYEEAMTIYDRLLASGIDHPRIHYNRGIALMCTDAYDEAARSFIRAIDRQLPVDVISGVREELHPSYKAPWEALRITFSLAGREDLAKSDSMKLADIKKALNVQ